MASIFEESARDLFSAHKDHSPRPLMSQKFKELDESTAYQVQMEYVKLLSGVDRISGYKAALTSSVAQEMFNASGAASGVLFASGQYMSGDELRLGDFVMPVIETEIGFRMAQGLNAADAPVSRQRLEEQIDTALPMVEIADIGFVERVSNAPDLIAGNSGSAGYVLGDEPAIEFNLNKVAVRLFKDGQEISAGVGADAMGDQLDALTWLVNQVLGKGYEILPGTFLMTGSLGGISIAKAGEYLADYGDFGKITFSFT